MGEETVTVMGETRPLSKPFFLLATQNPLGLEGTYSLPEAQMDRFLWKIHVSHPSEMELKEIIRRTTGTISLVINKIMDAQEVIRYQNFVREIIVAEEMLDFAVKIVMATHPDSDYAPQMEKIRSLWSRTTGVTKFDPDGEGAQSVSRLISCFNR